MDKSNSNYQHFPVYETGNKIKIKDKNKGSFTRYCGGNVTEECIRKGKNSNNPKIRKKAIFAQNARKWAKKGQYGTNLTFDENLAHNTSDLIMQAGRNIGTGKVIDITDSNNNYRNPAQTTYLLPRNLQEKVFLNRGYIKGIPNDYGLVKKAVGNRNIPVYQTSEDDIDRSQLTPIGSDTNVSTIFELRPGTRLYHAGSYPTAYYVDNISGDVYSKSWDLNDYGDGGGGNGRKYGKKQFLANLIDKIGSPTVVTTGFKKNYKTSFVGKNGISYKTLPTNLNLFDDFDYILRNPSDVHETLPFQILKNLNKTIVYDENGKAYLSDVKAAEIRPQIQKYQKGDKFDEDIKIVWNQNNYDNNLV